MLYLTVSFSNAISIIIMGSLLLFIQNEFDILSRESLLSSLEKIPNWSALSGSGQTSNMKPNTRTADSELKGDGRFMLSRMLLFEDYSN